MECDEVDFDSTMSNVYAAHKGKCNGVYEEEEPFNSGSNKDPIFHDSAPSLTVRVEIFYKKKLSW